MNPTPIQDAVSYRNDILNRYTEHLENTDESLWEMSNGFIRTAKGLDDDKWTNWPPIPQSPPEHLLEHEAILYMDTYSGDFFMSLPELVQQAMYHVNRNICLKGYETVSGWYDLLGIGEVNANMDTLGWSQDYLIEAQNSIWLDFYISEQLATGDGMPYWAITFGIDPVPFEDEGY